MKRLIPILLLLITGAILVFTVSATSVSPQDGGPGYDAQWAKVDSLERKGLYRMALAEVGLIFDQATKDENHNHVIKAVLYELKYNVYLEEDDYVLGIYRLDELVAKAPSPSKEILHSLIAEVYWGYYSSNSWKFTDRTNVVEMDIKDIRTWDLKRIAEKVRYHYLMSLMNREISQTRPMDEFDEIASYASESSDIRPTLFDFLAHRALDFFKYNMFNVAGPAETFVIEDENYFGSNSAFLAVQPATPDSLNTSFFAVRLLQELTRFHLEKNNQPALFEVELERIKYIKDKSVLSNNNELYYAALQRMTSSYSSIPYVSEAWYELAVVHSQRGDSYSHLGDTTSRWEKKVAIEICDKTIATYKNAYGSQQCEGLRSNIRQKNLVMLGEEAIVPVVNSKVLIQYKNIDKIYLKVARYDYKKFYNNRYDYDKFQKELRTMKGVFTKEVKLTNPGDYQNHSAEVLIPGLDNGFYFVIIGTSPDFSGQNEAFAYMPLWATNITYQTRKKDNNIFQVAASNRATGEPLAGAKVHVSYEEYNYKLRYYEQKTVGNLTTDANGLVEFDGGHDYRTYQVTVTHNGETYAPNQGVYNYNYYYGDENYTTTHTQFFTDRKIYRPGQTIYFKGISISYEGYDRKLVTGQTSTVSLYDVNGQEIATKEVTSNQFGSFEGSFTAPFGVLTGQMSISNSYGATYFNVEEYKRPKFEVTMNPVEGEIMVNDSVTVTGNAQAFAGNKIDGAAVKYRIVRSTGYNWSYYWHWRPYNQPKEIQQGDLITDDNGDFKVKFVAAPDKTVDPKNLPRFTYTIYADVTDINGETHSASTSFVVGYQSLELGNNLSADMNNSEDYFLRLSATNLNGQKIPATGKITVAKLKMPDRVFYPRLWSMPDMQTWTEKEFYALFPLEQYKNENDIYTWEKDKEVFKTTFDTKITDSIAISNYAAWEPGAYIYEAVSKDKNGIEVKDIYYFTVYNPESKIAPRNEVLWIKNVQHTAEPGEIVDVLLATKEKNVSVLYDVEVANKVIESKRIVLNNEQVKLPFPVSEAHRGNFTIHFTAIKNNRKFGQSITIVVPYTNKELDLEFSTFRNKLLPGAEEEWTLTVRNKKGQKEVAELLATLYDASLDELYTPNSFFMSIYATYYGYANWGEALGIRTTYAYNTNYYWNEYVSYPYRYFPSLNYHGYSAYYYGRYYYYDYDDYGGEYEVSGAVSEKQELKEDSNKDRNKNTESGYFSTGRAEGESMDMSVADSAPIGGNAQTITTATGGVPAMYGDMTRTTADGKLTDLSNISARSNFNETAFFYPQLTTNANGDVQIKFTIPESLTKWKFLGMAHTQDLKIGSIQEEVVTQKDLMVVPNAPRFLREGDKITIAAKISNISKENLAGRVQLDLIDPSSEESLNDQFKLKIVQQEFKADAGKSTVVSWNIEVPYQLSAVKYKIVAGAGNFSDGEENVLPILSNRMLVTESMPMPVRGNQTRTFHLQKLKTNKSKTLVHHRYTVEFTSNPAWYAIQAMPYMMEYPYECAEQTFTRYYSNAIASHIMNTNPKIKQVIDEWGENSPEAFLSNLQKNEELKELILQETPWVLDAKSEEQSKKNLAVLLDMDRMSKELDKALTKTIKAQSVNGGWPWFPGMPESRYITQHIITGMGHLDHLGIKDVKENHKVWQMVKNGVQYLDGEIYKDYKYAKKYDPDYLKNQHIGYSQVQYLYARSYFPQIDMNKDTKEAVSYYKDQAQKFWLNFNIYAEGMIALAAHRFEMTSLATDIVKSLKDRSIKHDEFGMYWKDYTVGYYWYEAPVETQALMIEMFDEVTNDQESVEELKIWLLKQKQTTNWKTTKQTTEAVYALLLKGSDLLANDQLVEITVGGSPIVYTDKPDKENPYQVKAQAGTGYFKTAWTGDKIKENMGEVTIKKQSKGIAWGAAYWQYFEDLDKITFAETPLSLKKQLFTVEVSNQGEQLKPISANNVLKVGDKIRVRIELRTDRNLEYVHMKDMRASGFEPINVLSRYKYQDGLGYYEATKDAATNFFFDYIPKGTYVFEYDLRVQHKGDFSNGITTIQCMYAPEFTSHSEGIRVVVE